MADHGRLDITTRDLAGNVLVGAFVWVLQAGTQVPAACFDSEGNPIGNPRVSGQGGRLAVFLAPGDYDVRVEGRGFTDLMTRLTVSATED